MTANSFRLAALLLLFGLGLTACGVNGAPDPPTPDKFPHQYPPPETPPGAAAATAAPAPRRRPRHTRRTPRTPTSPCINELFSLSGRHPSCRRGAARPAGCGRRNPVLLLFLGRPDRALSVLHPRLRRRARHHLLLAEGQFQPGGDRHLRAAGCRSRCRLGGRAAPGAGGGRPARAHRLRRGRQERRRDDRRPRGGHPAVQCRIPAGAGASRPSGAGPGQARPRGAPGQPRCRRPHP